MNIMDMFLLVTMTMAALWAVLGRSLLKATIALAVTSAVITILMFRLNAPLAAVFELSVCTGLITVVFVSTISLTKPLTHQETIDRTKDRIKRYWYLPVLIIIAGVALSFVKMPLDFARPHVLGEGDVRSILWNSRQLDIFGQIAIILAGVFGVVILFREANRDD
jgi:NADH-quinone oxidoreductase subunit J